MIDWKKTNYVFGISENVATKTSRIIIICDKCKEQRDIIYATYKNQLRLTGSDDCSSCKAKNNRVKHRESYVNSDINRAKSLSVTMKEKWNNEEYRNAQIISINSDSNIKTLSDISKLKWQDDIYRNNVVNSIKVKYRDDDFKNKMRLIWDSDEFKLKSRPILSEDQLKRLKEGVIKKWLDEKYKSIQSISRIGNVTSDETKKKLHDIMIDKWQDENFKINFSIGREKCVVKQSSIETTLYQMLDDLNIKYIKQHRIGFYLFDCFLSDYNILIECNGDYWHSLPKAIKNDKSKSSYITNNFTEYKLHYIWEHEFKCKDKVIELIKYWTGTKLDIINFDFKNLIIKDININDSRLFVDKYHYSGTIGNSTYRYGCYLNDELIALCSFGNITRNESATRLNINSNELLELTRFCIHSKYQKKNFASWLISRCINEIVKLEKYKCLISFADTTYNHDGTIYKALGWVNDGVVPPSYWYIDKDGYVMHKKTLWNHSKKMSMTENDFAEKYGYTKIAGKKKIRYVKWIK